MLEKLQKVDLLRSKFYTKSYIFIINVGAPVMAKNVLMHDVPKTSGRRKLKRQYPFGGNPDHDNIRTDDGKRLRTSNPENNAS